MCKIFSSYREAECENYFLRKRTGGNISFSKGKLGHLLACFRDSESDVYIERDSKLIAAGEYFDLVFARKPGCS